MVVVWPIERTMEERAVAKGSGGIVPDGVASPQANPLGNGPVLLLRLGELLLRTGRLVALLLCEDHGQRLRSSCDTSFPVMTSKSSSLNHEQLLLSLIAKEALIPSVSLLFPEEMVTYRHFDCCCRDVREEGCSIDSFVEVQTSRARIMNFCVG